MERRTTLARKTFLPKLPQHSQIFMVFEEELYPRNSYQKKQATSPQERQETQVSRMQLGGLGWDVWHTVSKPCHDMSRMPLLTEQFHSRIDKMG